MSKSTNALRAAYARRAITTLALAGAAASALALDAPLAADAHISSVQPGLNFGALPTLNVGGGSTALLQFDLATLPAAVTPAKLVKASLLLWVNRVGTPGTVELQTVMSAWTEAGVSAATAPVLGGPGSGTLVPVGAAGQFVAVDVTAQVKGWIANPASNFGLALAPALQAPATIAFFDSKENTATGHVARLDLTLADQGPLGPTGATGARGPKGDTGPSGGPGATGATGAAGAIGAAGVMGAAGATGATGARGPIGEKGTPGATGPKGSTGTNGLNGTKGTKGTKGTNGTNGATGNTGPAGPVNLTYVRGNFTVDGRFASVGWAHLTLVCPAATNVIGGGCGHRDDNDAQTDIAVNYSGPDFVSPRSQYTCRVTNSGASSRAIAAFAVCASATNVTGP